MSTDDRQAYDEVPMPSLDGVGAADPGSPATSGADGQLPVHEAPVKRKRGRPPKKKEANTEPEKPKRPRGRPRKEKTSGESDGAEEKRPRGRPRKEKVVSSTASEDAAPAPKRGPGRPRKEPETNQEKKKRGRPKGSKDGKKRKAKGSSTAISSAGQATATAAASAAAGRKDDVSDDSEEEDYDARDIPTEHLNPSSSAVVGIGDNEEIRSDKAKDSGAVTRGRRKGPTVTKYAATIQDCWGKKIRPKVATMIKNVGRIMKSTTLDPEKAAENGEKPGSPPLPKVEWMLLGKVSITDHDEGGGRKSEEKGTNKATVLTRTKPLLIIHRLSNESEISITETLKAYRREEQDRASANATTAEWNYQSCTPAVLDGFDEDTMTDFCNTFVLRTKPDTAARPIGQTMKQAVERRKSI